MRIWQVEVTARWQLPRLLRPCRLPWPRFSCPLDRPTQPRLRPLLWRVKNWRRALPQRLLLLPLPLLLLALVVLKCSRRCLLVCSSQTSEEQLQHLQQLVRRPPL